jgi:hypothetical protein
LVGGPNTLVAALRIRKRENYMITKQRGEGAHLLDALWLLTLGDVTSLRRLRFQCRNIGQKIAENEISEMIEHLEESKTKRKNDRGSKARPVINQVVGLAP